MDSRGFKDLLDSQSLVDCTLACDGGKISAHKIVLSICSSYLNKILQEHPVEHPIIILPELNIEDVRTLVHYMYTGELLRPSSSASSTFNLQPHSSSLLKTAAFLSVNSLCDFLNSTSNLAAIAAATAAAASSHPPPPPPPTHQEPLVQPLIGSLHEEQHANIQIQQQQQQQQVQLAVEQANLPSPPSSRSGASSVSSSLPSSPSVVTLSNASNATTTNSPAASNVNSSPNFLSPLLASQMNASSAAQAIQAAAVNLLTGNQFNGLVDNLASSLSAAVQPVPPDPSSAAAAAAFANFPFAAAAAASLANLFPATATTTGQPIVAVAGGNNQLDASQQIIASAGSGGKQQQTINMSSSNMFVNGAASKAEFQFRCPVCLEFFHTICSFEYHMQKSHNVTSFGCEICQKPFASLRYVLTDHMRRCHGWRAEQQHHQQLAASANQAAKFLPN